MYAYRNENTGDVRRFEQPHPRLEALSNWTPIPNPGDALDERAASSAAAERASIEAAAAARAQAAGDKAAAVADRETARATSQYGDTPPAVTLTHYEPGQPRTVTVPEVSEVAPGAPDGILTREQGPAGPSPAELLARQAADATTPHPSVLLRGTGDAATDTGELRARALRDMENPRPDGVLSRDIPPVEPEPPHAPAAATDEPELTPTPEPSGELDPTSDEAEATPTPTPATGALKAEWVAYAVSRGMTEADAQALTKPELVAKFAAPASE